ncbi:MAG: type II secretion system F family protein [Actinomycetes bacterium]
MTGLRRRIIVLAVLTTALVLHGAAAMAVTSGPAVKGQIVHIETSTGRVQVIFQANNLPPGTRIDVNSVRVRVDGRTLVANAVPVASISKPTKRTAVLAFDNSRSMKGAKLDAAKQAALAFIGGLPPDVAVGLVTFNQDAQVISEPTLDRQQLTEKINSLALSPVVGTALYKGTAVALGLAGTEGTRSVLMLTDGRPSGSDARRVEVLDQVAKADTPVNAVYIGADPAPPDGLKELVAGGTGQVIKSDPAALSSVFGQAAQAIERQLQITAKVPPSLAGQQATLEVAATAGNDVLTDQAFATFAKRRSGPVARTDYGPQAVKPGGTATLVSDSVLPLALAALFLGLLGLMSVSVAAAGGNTSQRTRLRRRLSFYTLTGRQATAVPRPETRLGGSHVARSAVELAGRVVEKRDFETAVGQRLEAAGVPLRTAEWMLIHIGVALLFPLLFLLVSGGAIAPTLIGLVLGLALPWVYLSYKESRRTSAFLAQLPDTLQLVAGSLSAGYSMPQALDTVVREGQQPITGEFNRALVEARLGVPIEDALEGVGQRMKSKDFEWVVMAIRIQREVGGNLAEVLTTVAGTLRERERLRRQVQVLSAEGRLSAWILGALPLVFTLYLVLSRPDYLRPLVTQPLGWLLVVTGSVLLTVGIIWMRKAVKVEV